MAQPYRLMSYNPQWRQEFEQSRSSMLQATEGWLCEIVHIGSTSLDDGIARPVVDLMAGMQDMQGLNDVCALIEGLNYRRQATPAWCDEELCALMHKPRAAAATHSVLIVRHQGSLWKRAVAVRNRLATHPQERVELNQTKMNNFNSGCSGEAAYLDAKDLFFRQLEQSIQSDQ